MDDLSIFAGGACLNVTLRFVFLFTHPQRFFYFAHSHSHPHPISPFPTPFSFSKPFIMRYENWDVILFPADSRTPIQEFKTQCFVGKDTASPYLKYHYQSTFTGAGLGSSSYYPLPANSGQVPVLTCFIQTLPKDTPFRVSIHSWDKPHPSRLVQGIMEVDDVLLYEARIMVDGEFKAWVSSCTTEYSQNKFFLLTQWLEVVCSRKGRSGLTLLVSRSCFGFSYGKSIPHTNHWDFWIRYELSWVTLRANC